MKALLICQQPRAETPQAGLHYIFSYSHPPLSKTVSINLFSPLRFFVGKRFLAGSTDWPTSAPVYPSYRAASQRSGSLQPHCSLVSAKSSRMSWKKQRTQPHPQPWQVLQLLPELGVTLNYEHLQSHTFRTVSE